MQARTHARTASNCSATCLLISVPKSLPSLQVNAYAAAHGFQYGMISNILWSWAFVMDGRNNMQISQPLQYDAAHPTVLQVGLYKPNHWDVSLPKHSAAVVSDSLLQFQISFFMQVHAWVTAMSLKGKTLQPWETFKHHPFVEVPVEKSKRPQTRSLQAQSKKLRLTPAASKPAHPKPSNEAAAGRSRRTQQSLSVPLHANAPSLLPDTASPLAGDAVSGSKDGAFACSFRVLNGMHAFCASCGDQRASFQCQV